MQPENLQYLAEALGLPGLEVVQSQQQVGPFYADIVCRVLDTEHIVLIENQLDQADHRHLGQVLTYAPHVDAKTCVWVASSIRDEHRAAVDWLNRITSEGYNFFGVEVSAVKIGDSQPAPLFEVVAKPNEFSRITPSVADPDTEGVKEDNVSYWAGFHSFLIDQGGPIRKVTKDLRETTYWAPIGSNGRAYIWAFRSRSRNPYVTAGMSIYNAGAVQIGEILEIEKADFEANLGEQLIWFANKPRTAFHIQYENRPASLSADDWPAQYEWLAERMKALKTVLGEALAAAFIAYDVQTAAS